MTFPGQFFYKGIYQTQGHIDITCQLSLRRDCPSLYGFEEPQRSEISSLRTGGLRAIEFGRQIMKEYLVGMRGLFRSLDSGHAQMCAQSSANSVTGTGPSPLRIDPCGDFVAVPPQHARRHTTPPWMSKTPSILIGVSLSQGQPCESSTPRHTV